MKTHLSFDADRVCCGLSTYYVDTTPYVEECDCKNCLRKWREFVNKCNKEEKQEKRRLKNGNIVK